MRHIKVLAGANGACVGCVGCQPFARWFRARVVPNALLSPPLTSSHMQALFPRFKPAMQMLRGPTHHHHHASTSPPSINPVHRTIAPSHQRYACSPAWFTKSPAIATPPAREPAAPRHSSFRFQIAMASLSATCLSGRNCTQACDEGPVGLRRHAARTCGREGPASWCC